MLGFRTEKVYNANILHESDSLVNINPINYIYIESNLVAGSLKNGRICHTIHEFYPNVPPSYKIMEVPRHLVYYSLNCMSINQISVVLKEQNSKLIDLSGEPILIRLLIQDGSTVL